jgi:hypothetical protein
MSPSGQRFTRAVTVSTTLNADSIKLVVASVRRSGSGNANPNGAFFQI